MGGNGGPEKLRVQPRVTDKPETDVGEHLRCRLPVQSSQEVLHLLVSWDFLSFHLPWGSERGGSWSLSVVVESRAVGLWRLLLWDK